MSGLLCLVLSLYLLAIIIRSFLSFVPGASTSALGTALFRVTEPVLGPVRRVVPAVRLGAGGFDLSPLVVTFGIIVLRGFVC